MNTIGTIYRITTFGESHGPAVGGVIDGVPAGITIDFDAVAAQLARRRPGQSALTTARNESDAAEFLSGFLGNTTLGSPIGFIIRNSDTRSSDYDNMARLYRPNHADYSYDAKYGIRDHRGGGRSSARVTAPLVVAGAIARQALEQRGIAVQAYPVEIGGTRGTIEDMEGAITQARRSGDSVGGIIECVASGVPAGIGEPIGGKLHAMLASAMMSINAAKGFEYGDGFAGAAARGSECADLPYSDSDGRIRTRANHSGGIQGGISNGEDIVMRIAFKPVPTIAIPLETIDSDGNAATLAARGRHDPCVIPRAVPIVEAMAAITIFDAMLLNRCAKWNI